MTEELATFDDRWTMRYTRTYPHPIERVWRAVTEAEHLDVWLAPACGVVVEGRLGGRCAFAFGGANPELPEHDPADASTFSYEGTITAFDPPHLVHYQLEDSALRFELREVAEGTQLEFVHAFRRGASWPVPAEPGDMASGQPAGPGTPWRPGFLAGFHLMLDQLGDMLDGRWTYDDARRYIDAVRDTGSVHAVMATDEPDPRYMDLVARYHEHTRDHCPTQ